MEQVHSILSKESNQLLSQKEILESYRDIVLTPDEIREAIIWAKAKKRESLRLARIKQLEEENRKRKQQAFDFSMMKTFMMNRADKMFKGEFVIDEYNERVFEMLCYYFNNDSTFVTLADAFGVKNPSMDKGICLAGIYGTGKSWLLKLFMQNKRQSYFIRSAKQIANQYVQAKEKTIPSEYLFPFKNAFQDSDVFYQPESGLCIDDIGAESLKNNYGNISNVIGDLIEMRYDYREPETNKRLIGPMLHGSTNLTSEELKTYYGGRVLSRMREIFNFIKVPGEDRRK